MTDTVNVPRDPTEAMLRAGANPKYPCDAKDVWEAMLAAAPKAEQEPVGKVVAAHFKTRTVTVAWDRWPVKIGSSVYAHPDPASDELLEALEVVAEEFEYSPDDKDKFGYPIQSPRIYSAWQTVRGFLAKHKGPQS